MGKQNNIQILHQLRDIDFAELDKFSQAQKYHNGLREYQQHNKSAIYKTWGNGSTNIMLQMPTGMGKTHLFASIIKDLQDYFFKKACEAQLNSWEERQRWALPKILVLVHRIELIEQIHDTLAEKYKHTSGIVSGGMIMGETKNVIVASVQTLSRKKKLDKWEKEVNFDFIIIDEAHHSTADSYRRIRAAWPDARLLGVTATPYRLNHQPFTDVYDKLILSEPVYRFIEKGYLCQYDYCSIKPNSHIQYEIDHLATDFSGDYDEQAMEILLNQDRIRASILGTYEKFAKGKKGIVYTINRLHNQMLATLFTSHGYNVAYIDSQTSKEERRKTVDEFRRGEIEIIFNVNIFSEGFDCPDVEFIQLARPTKSLSMYLQQVGRGFRVAKGKKKVIFLDNVGLYNRFGLPSARRAWQHYFEGCEDWEEEKGGDNGSLGEPHDTGADLSEGNEEVNLIYTSFSEQTAEEEQPPMEETEIVTTDSGIVNQDNEQQETNDNMAVETLIICNGHDFVVEKLSQKELAEMLLLIEEVRHTGMIDVEKLKQTIKSLDEKRRRDMERFILNSGYSKEELMAFLSSKGLVLPSKLKNDKEESLPTQDVDEIIHEGLYVVTEDYELIQESTGSKTLLRALNEIGYKKVYEACWTKFWDDRELMQSLILTKSNPSYEKRSGQHVCEENGVKYYIITNSNTPTKMRQLKNLSNKLNLGWKVGIKDGKQ
jgi:superfamily II DNA or RNA helicase